MPAVFLYADPHFGHQGVCKFLREDGTKLRPFDNAEEMDVELIKRFNETVRPNDKVYFLGDVAMRAKELHRVMPQLNGDKVLIKGNHDIFKMSEYSRHFRDIRGYHVMNGCILSHIPIHEESLGRFGCSIHGHLHYRRVMKARGFDAKAGKIIYGNEIDTRYFNVSVEHTNYAPILFEDACKKIIEQGGTVGFRDRGGPIM